MMRSSGSICGVGMRGRADSNWRQIVRALPALVAAGALLACLPCAGLAGGRLGSSDEGQVAAPPVRQTAPQPAHPPPGSPRENQGEPIGPLALRHPEIFACIGQAVTAAADRLKDLNEVKKLVDNEKFYHAIINKCSKAYPDEAPAAERYILVSDVTGVLEDWLKNAALAAKQAEDEQLRKQAEVDVDRARQLYVGCLFAKTETLALASTEPAQTIVQAAFGACGKSFRAIEDKAISAGRDPA